MSALLKNTISICAVVLFVIADVHAIAEVYKVDARRTGYNNSAQFKMPLMMSWKSIKRTGEDTKVQYSSPVVGQDKIYIGNSNGNIEAYYRSVNSFNSLGEAENVAWSRNCDGPIYGTPAVDDTSGDEMIYIGTTSGTLLCLYGTNGTVAWEKQLGGAFFASPMVIDISGQRAIVTSNVSVRSRHIF